MISSTPSPSRPPTATRILRDRAARSWKAVVDRFAVPSLPRSAWQLANTLIPYAALWVAMAFAIRVSYWLALPLMILAGGFLVRIFIIFHDCGHEAFFRSRKANHVWGFITGVLTFTPYHHWRWEHAVHHGTSGDLDRRGTGDIWTLTVQEYLEASWRKRLAYRLARNPVVLFVLAPLGIFLVQQRFASPRASRRARRSVRWTNLALVAMGAGLSWALGVGPYLMIQLTVMLVAGSAGIWLFYVQHQFEGVYWKRSEEWDYTTASLEGSSFYKLPKILQWFSGSIGFHHLHHLSPRIPNYRLEACHKAEPEFQKAPTVTFFQSFKSLGYRLYDEERQRLVGFGALRHLQAERIRS